MINLKALKYLQSINSYPCVSILMPTHRHFPENKQDPLRLKNLINLATKRLNEEFKKEEVKQILDKINEINQSIDYNSFLDGLAIFVNKDKAIKFYLPFPVKERVIIDPTFATRDLVFGINRSEPYWVLVISDKIAKLFLGIRDNIIEYTENEFPFTNTYYETKSSLTTETHRNDRQSDNIERIRKYLRELDSKLKNINVDNYSVVITGTERTLSLYNDISSQKELILTGINGNYETVSAHELSKIVWPEVKRVRAEKRDKIIKEIEEAYGKRKLASGVDEVWKLANEGRGRLLVVELNYQYSARVSDDGLHLIPVEVAPGKEIIDDAVDDIIERVVNTGGSVVFVDNGKLDKYGHIALILRY
ncbi:MAG: hypothetical protein N2490_00885 [Ignavibacteria bacterium]|nr:hypothetical protein [Ignavibacteria bacterium]